jgi:hypothetical protein
MHQYRPNCPNNYWLLCVAVNYYEVHCISWIHTRPFK